MFRLLQFAVDYHVELADVLFVVAHSLLYRNEAIDYGFQLLGNLIDDGHDLLWDFSLLI